MTYRWQKIGNLSVDPEEPGMPGLTYTPESMGGDLGRRVSVHSDTRRASHGRERIMSIKETGPKGGIGALIRHDSDFTLSNVIQHLGNPETAYRVIKDVGEGGTGKGAAAGPSRKGEYLHIQGNVVGPSRYHHEQLQEGSRLLSTNPGRLYQLNKEQHGVVFDASDEDISRFAIEGWRGATTDSKSGLARLEDDCIETASFTSSGTLYKPSNKPGC